MKIQTRIAELEKIIAKEEISEANGATPQYDENGKVKVEIATCGNCGMSWNDALITGRTPVPSARCPYEYIHAEIAELKRLKAKAVEVKKGASVVTYCADSYGYTVHVVRDGEVIEEYHAGNFDRDSQQVVNPGTPGAVSPQQLRAWAKKTAKEYADEYKIATVMYDFDLAQSLREERAEMERI